MMDLLLFMFVTSVALNVIEGYPEHQFGLRRGDGHGHGNGFPPDTPCAHYTSALINSQSQGRIVNRPTRINGEGGGAEHLDSAASHTHNAPLLPLPAGPQGPPGFHYEQQFNQEAVNAFQGTPSEGLGIGVPLAPPVSLPIVPPSLPLTPPPPPPPAHSHHQHHHQFPPTLPPPPQYYLNTQTQTNNNYNNNYNNNNNLYSSSSQYYTKGQYATQSQPVYSSAAYYSKPTGAESVSAASIDFAASSLNSANTNRYQQNSGAYASSYDHSTFANSQQTAFNGGSSSAGSISITGSSNNNNALDGQLGQVIQETFAQTALDPSFEKHIYVHVPPEELEEEHAKAESPIPVKLQKHYNIVFIKAPTPAATSNYLLPQLMPQTEEKTLVYVLVKKPDEENIQALQEQLQQTAIKSSKPEVYFIKYKTRTDDAAGDYQKSYDNGAFLRDHITQLSESNNYSYSGIDSANSISLAAATAATQESGLTSGSDSSGGGGSGATTLSHSAYGVPLN